MAPLLRAMCATTALLSAAPTLAAMDEQFGGVVTTEVFEGEDECLTGASGTSCALHALQVKGSILATAALEDGGGKEQAIFKADEADTEDAEFQDDQEADHLEGADGQDDAYDDYEDEAEANFKLTAADKIPVTGCDGLNGTACPAGEQCVVKDDKSFSQCVDCSGTSFGRECQKLDDHMRYAAIQTCQRTCLSTMCYNHRWCFKPYHCIVDKKEHWGQCISCNSKKFWTSSCNALKPGLKKKASNTCHRKCTR